MKGVKCIKSLICFTILALSFVLFSADTSAVDYTSNITFLGQKNATNFNCYWRTSNDSTLTETLALPLTLPKITLANGSDQVERYIDYCVANGTFDVKKDNLYELKVIMRVPDATEYPLTVINSTASSNERDGVTWTIVNVKLDIWGDGTVAGGTTYTPTNSLVPLYRPTEIYPRQIAQYSFLLKPSADHNNVHIVLGRAGQHMFYFPYISVGMDMYQSNYELPRINFSPSNVINEYTLIDPSAEMNDKDDEDRSNLESQSSDTDSSASSSSEDAESTGTTLLGAFSAFVTALTSASPSNCNIDMDLGNLDLGVVNLCQLSPPQPIPTIASIFMILFCVPLSIATARKVISLFRSFQ